MNRYATTVRRWWAVPPALLALVLVCRTAGALELPVPSLSGGTTGARLDHLAPLIVVAAVMYCLDRGIPEAEATAVAPVRTLDAAALLLTGALTHPAAPLVGLAVPRNTLLLLAVAVLAHRLTHATGATFTALGALFLTLLIADPGDPYWWALPLHPSDSLPAWLASVALFGAALWFKGARR